MTYQTTPRLFCFGLGYSASVLARALLSEGWRVAGTCRDNSTQKTLIAQGVDAYIFDGQSPLQNFNDVLVGTTHLLSSVPPVNSKDPILQIHGAQIAAMTSLQWTGYLSTTGVYGNQSGGWVDETSPLEPTGDRGQRRVDAELAWLETTRFPYIYSGWQVFMGRDATKLTPSETAPPNASISLAKFSAVYTWTI